MRLLNVIFALYVMIVACYPCVSMCVHEAAASYGATANHDEHGSDGCDACTPFCFDGCCVPHVICQVITPGIPDVTVYERPAPLYSEEGPTLPISKNIWQPPGI